jgi:hypothetical protein
MVHDVTTTTVHDIMMTAFLHTLIIMSIVCQVTTTMVDDVTTTKFLAMVQGVVFPITLNLVLVKTTGTSPSHVPATIVIKVFFHDHYFPALEIVSWTEIRTILSVRLPGMHL